MVPHEPSGTVPPAYPQEVGQLSLGEHEAMAGQAFCPPLPSGTVVAPDPGAVGHVPSGAQAGAKHNCDTCFVGAVPGHVPPFWGAGLVQSASNMAVCVPSVPQAGAEHELHGVFRTGYELGAEGLSLFDHPPGTGQPCTVQELLAKLPLNVPLLHVLVWDTAVHDVPHATLELW